jgi:hypothetical protein
MGVLVDINNEAATAAVLDAETIRLEGRGAWG